MPQFFDPRGLNLYAKPRPGEGDLEKASPRTGNFLLGLGLLTMIACLIIVFWNLISGAPAWMGVAAVSALIGALSYITGRLFQFVSLVEGHINQVEARLTEKEKEGTNNASGTSE